MNTKPGAVELYGGQELKGISHPGTKVFPDGVFFHSPDDGFSVKDVKIIPG